MKAGLLLALVAAGGVACSDAAPPPTRSAEQVAAGKSKRAFWKSYDAARKAYVVNDLVTARAHYVAALEADPQHASSLYALAGIEWRGKRHAEAIALAQRLEQAERPKTRALLLRASIQSDVETLAGAGQVEARWFDLDAAAAAIDEAAGINPEETGPHVARARVAMLRDDPATAVESLARALTIHPDDAGARVLLAVAHRRLGDDAAAREHVGRALSSTAPKTDEPVVLGDGDTVESLGKDHGRSTPRLRALALLARLGGTPWPDAAPRLRAQPLAVDSVPRPEAPQLRVLADFDGDGEPDELTARRASETASLRWLFGMEHDEPSFTLLRNGADVTAASGLEGVATGAGALVAIDLDADGDLDVAVLRGQSDPTRVEPPLALVNDGRGRFTVALLQEAEREQQEGRVE